MIELPEVLNAEEIAELLKLNPNDARRYCREGIIPATRILGNWKASRKALLDWIYQQSMSNTMHQDKSTVSNIDDYCKGGE